MGNVLCCEQGEKPISSGNKNQGNNHINAPQPVYYTNPEPKDEDFTFNDKLKLQSMGGKWEDRQIPSFPDKGDDSWNYVAQLVLSEINRLNSDPDWNKTTLELGPKGSNEQSQKAALELIYSQDDERIYFGSKMLTGKQIERIMPKARQSSPSPSRITSNEKEQQQQACSFRNSQTHNSIQAMGSNGPTLLSNPNFTKESTKDQQMSFSNNSFQPATFSANNLVNNSNNNNNNRIPRQSQQQSQTVSQQQQITRPQCVNIVKLEFEVNCSAEKMVKGLQDLKRFTSKIEKMEIVSSSEDKEFQVLHLVFGKYIQKVQRDLVVAHYRSEIGQNLNDCYVSVNHCQIPEQQDVTRVQVIKAGHTFFEHYTTAQDASGNQNTSKSQLQDNSEISNNLNNNINNNSTFNNKSNGNGAFGSMNLNIQVKTKIRFYGEFLCNSSQDESLVRMVFLTEFKDYIGICKSISIASESTVSDLDQDMDHVDATRSEFDSQFSQNQQQ